ncbi:MAG: Flavin reductase [Myxococcales bacterium]|nr:Flavin reductase [Myxococcales bacterium]
MRLLVLGATGNTGREILDRALARGHHVTAFVRSPEKLAPAAGLAIVPGDPRDRAALAAALVGHDAVVSAIGMRPPKAFRPHTLVADCAAATVDAMGIAGVQRLAIVSAAVLFPERGLVFAFFRWLLKHIARDLGAMEGVVRASALDWTIVRPPRLVQSADESWRFAVDALPAHGRTMGFRALAAFLVDAVEQDAHPRALVGLAR